MWTNQTIGFASYVCYTSLTVSFFLNASFPVDLVTREVYQDVILPELSAFGVTAANFTASLFVAGTYQSTLVLLPAPQPQPHLRPESQSGEQEVGDQETDGVGAEYSFTMSCASWAQTQAPRPRRDTSSGFSIMPFIGIFPVLWVLFLVAIANRARREREENENCERQRLIGRQEVSTLPELPEEPLSPASPTCNPNPNLDSYSNSSANPALESEIELQTTPGENLTTSDASSQSEFSKG